MKDNWTQSFQERLGDYELDVPVPATMPGQRKILPWLLPSAAAAAAAALALLLLLPAGQRSAASSPERLIAEASPQVSAPLPDLPASRLQAVPSQAGRQQAVSQEASRPQPSVIVPETVSETTPETVSEAQPENNPATTPEPVVVTGTTPVTPDTPAYDPLWPEESVQRNTAHGVSFKLYAGNFTAGEAQFQATPEIENMRDAYASYSRKDSDTAIGNDLYSNTIVRAYHPVNANEMTGLETVCDLPLKAGLSVRYDITPRLGLESGLTYSYHHAKQSYSGNLSGNYYYDYRMHYLGIPLKLALSLARWEHAGIYLNLGGEAELMATGRVTPMDGVTKNSTSLKEHPLQLSLLGAAGAEYIFNRHLSLYAEPGLAWHPEPSGSLPSYYRDHPWSFDLRVGLRFRLD